MKVPQQPGLGRAAVHKRCFFIRLIGLCLETNLHLRVCSELRCVVCLEPQPIPSVYLPAHRPRPSRNQIDSSFCASWRCTRPMSRLQTLTDLSGRSAPLVPLENDQFPCSLERLE